MIEGTCAKFAHVHTTLDNDILRKELNINEK